MFICSSNCDDDFYFEPKNIQNYESDKINLRKFKKCILIVTQVIFAISFLVELVESEE